MSSHRLDILAVSILSDFKGGDLCSWHKRATSRSEFFGQWWSCVRDATREAANSRVEDTKERNTGVLLKVECGDWTISEIVGGLGK